MSMFVNHDIMISSRDRMLMLQRLIAYDGNFLRLHDVLSVSSGWLHAKALCM